MNILAPLDSVKEVVPLAQAGATELYCGVYPENNKTKIPLNARPYKQFNLTSFRELREVVKQAHKVNVSVFFCSNFNAFGKKHQKILLQNLEQAISSGVDGIIVADQELARYLKKQKTPCKLIMSCRNPCFNTETLKFYKEHGLDRVVIPRPITLKQIAELNIDAKKIGIELEVFILNMICRNLNGDCAYHGLGFQKSYLEFSEDTKRAARYGKKVKIKSEVFKGIAEQERSDLFVSAYTSGELQIQPCRMSHELSVIDRGDLKHIKKKYENFALDADVHRYCALCSLYWLYLSGIPCVKIIGRGFLAKRKIQDVQMVARFLLALKENRVNEENYLEIGSKIYKDVLKKECGDRECHHIRIFKKKASSR